MIERCSAEKNEEQCYAKQFQKLTQQSDITHTLQVLAEIQDSEKSQDGCHFIAHVIASEEVLKNNGNWEKTLATLPINDCTGGFIMGTIEGVAHYHTDFVLNSGTALQMCQNVAQSSDQTESTLQTCIHTMGHLILVEKDGAVDPSIVECEELPVTYQYECFSGTFMENLFRRNLLAHGIGKAMSWHIESLFEQLTYCDSLSGDKGKACWRELSHMIIDVTQKDFDKISDFCLLAKEEEFAQACQKHAKGVLELTEKN